MFPSTADMVTAGLFTALNVTETGSYISYQRAWTGTWSGGTADTNTCNDWLDGSPAPRAGSGLCSEHHRRLVGERQLQL